jgi:predicted glycosyltransferase
MVKIFIYYVANNLGHTRCIFNLVKGLKLYSKQRISILVFQSGKSNHNLSFNLYAKVCNLPELQKDKSVVKNEDKLDDQELFLNILKKRISKIITALRDFSPDIFLTEFYPFGEDKWSRELFYVLRYVKANLNTKIFASIGYLIWKDNAFDILKEFYDGIFCHFPRDYLEEYLRSDSASRQGKTQFKKIIKHFPGRIYFTGFVVDKGYLDSIGFVKREKYILVSRGASKEKDKKDIIRNTLKIAESFENYNFIISLGLYADKREVHYYKKLADNKNNIILKRHITDFSRLMKGAVLNISMAGYNTVAELLYLRKECLIIPYHTEEQLFRAYFVNREYGVPVIFPEKMSFKRLEINIEQRLKNSRKPKVNLVDFQGQERFCWLINSIAFI